MKSITAMAAVAAVATVVAGCSTETYYGRSTYGYRPGYVYSTPSYAYSPPAYYRTTTYGYSYPQYSTRRTYDGYWDYQRNYRGIHASPEFSSM